jgi:antitoxin component of RelBE/YafQ-DinJ toxin-antitoxin module
MNTDRVILQIPLTRSLKKAAENAAQAEGFSSLQESIRLYLHKLVDGTLGFVIKEKAKPIQLSSRAEKRYAKMDKDFREGKNIYVAKSVDEFFKQLNGN